MGQKEERGVTVEVQIDATNATGWGKDGSHGKAKRKGARAGLVLDFDLDSDSDPESAGSDHPRETTKKQTERPIRRDATPGRCCLIRLGLPGSARASSRMGEAAGSTLDMGSSSGVAAS